MSYFEKIQIEAADSPSIDPFARWRVSSLTTLFENKQIFDSGSLYWNTRVKNNATASFNSNRASVNMIASGSNSYVLRQTRRRLNYQSGKGHFILCTGNFNTKNLAGKRVIKRIGYFDESNGIFFQTSGSFAGIVLRQNTSGTPVDTFVSQSSWNLDKMDGTGPSGKYLNLTASQILLFDMEWLGVGRVRYGIVQDGMPTYVHQITNANALSSTKPVYMSSPNLPVTYELINSASNTPTNLLQICSTVATEGGYDKTGPIRSVDIPRGGTITITANTQAAIIAIRLKSAYKASTVIPKEIGISNQGGNNNFKYMVMLNPVVSTPFVWADVPNSAVQYATGSVNHLITNEGTKLRSGYVSSTVDSSGVNFDSSLSLGVDVNGNSDTIVLGAFNFGTGTTFTGTLSWQESI